MLISGLLAAMLTVLSVILHLSPPAATGKQAESARLIT
jgi:hypothetical protein